METTMRNRAVKIALTVLLWLGCAGAALATAVASETLEAQPACAEEASGWRMTSGWWWYVNDDGSYATGWEYISGCWYYFDDDGWMQTGWLDLDDTWYYLRGSGAMALGWQDIWGEWYYFNDAGVMATGWLKAGSDWYYLKDSGAMAIGWEEVGTTWYYFYPDSGVMATGWTDVDGTWYHLDASGAMNADMWIGDYYVEGSGKMATSCWVGNYYVDADGRWIEGFDGTVFPDDATPAEDWVFSVSDGLITIHNYKGPGGTVIIPHMIGGMVVDRVTLSTASISKLDWRPTMFYYITIGDEDTNVENMSSGAPASELEVYCSSMGLGELYIGSSDTLVWLDCSDNFLFDELDVSGCPNLRTLLCSDNYLTDINIDGCDNLTYIDCRWNDLSDDAKEKLAAWGAQEGHTLLMD